MDECAYFCCSGDSGVRDIFENIAIPITSVFIENQPGHINRYHPKLIVCHCSDDANHTRFQQDSYHTDIIAMLRTNHPTTPIILTTRKHSAVVAVWALRWKISDLILIPDELSYLAQRIGDIIEHKVPHEKSENTLQYALKRNADRVAAPWLGSFKTSNAIHYIDKYYWRKISIRELAGSCDMSEQSFSRKFKREKGVTVREYIKYYRISIAAQLLIDKKFSIQQIAYKTGFDDASHFNRIFKSIESVTPTEYRANHSLSS